MMETSLLRNLIKKALVFVTTFLLLKYASFSCIVTTLGLLVLALPLSGGLICLMWYMQTREFIENLSDKAVVITGCDTGFGNSLAKTLDKKGVVVYAGCLLPEGEGATELKKSCSSNLRILGLDVTSDEQVGEAVRSVSETLGDKKLLAVVNNAGIGEVGDIEWFPMDTIHKIMEVNTFGVIRVTKAFLPLLRKSRGRVVIVSSFLGRFTMPGISAYCMSKHATISLADSLRRELRKWSISVHNVQPWLYRTDLTNTESILRGAEKNWSQISPDKRTEYGESYIDKYKVSLTNILNLGRPPTKIREVVEDMEHATIGKNPKSQYYPGIMCQLMIWICVYLPEEIVDHAMHEMFPQLKR